MYCLAANIAMSLSKASYDIFMCRTQVLKLYAWELSFQDKVNAVRLKELTTIKYIAFLNAVTTFLWTIAPVLVHSLFRKYYMLLCTLNCNDDKLLRTVL